MTNPLVKCLARFSAKLREIATPLPLFLICVFLLAVSSYFGVTAAAGLLAGAGGQVAGGGHIYIRAGTVAMNGAVMVAALFLLLGRRWARILLLVILGLAVLNNIAALLSGGEIVGNTLAVALLLAVFFYLLTSRAVKVRLGL